MRETPDGFVFSLKVPRAISHDRLLSGVDDELTRFLLALAPLREAGKLGPIVLQLPPRFRRDAHAEALAEFLAGWPRATRLAVELRHKSWWTEATYDALRAHDAALVWGVTEYGRSPPARTASWGYARLVGDRALDDEGGKWTHKQRDMDDELAYWIARIHEEGRGVKEFFIIANNHFEGFAPTTADRVARLLRERGFDLSLAARAEGQRGLGDFG